MVKYRNYRLNGYEQKLTYLWASLKTQSYEKIEREFGYLGNNI